MPITVDVHMRPWQRLTVGLAHATLINIQQMNNPLAVQLNQTLKLHHLARAPTL
jgi:hypothetical protein